MKRLDHVRAKLLNLRLRVVDLNHLPTAGRFRGTGLGRAEWPWPLNRPRPFRLRLGMEPDPHDVLRPFPSADANVADLRARELALE